MYDDDYNIIYIYVCRRREKYLYTYYNMCVHICSDDDRYPKTFCERQQTRVIQGQ